MYGGALKSEYCPDDYIYENTVHGKENHYLAEMPESYDLRRHMSPARDQGNRSTCGAHVAASIKEIQDSMTGGNSSPFSPEFIYYHRENKPAHGMYGRNVFQILQQIGAIPEEHYAHYGDDSPAPESWQYKIAASFRIKHFARVTTINGLKRALLEAGPCYMQLPLYRNRPEFWRAADGESQISGHAVAVVGYTAAGFIIKNSWGDLWGEDGCLVFPYSDFGAMLECWVAVNKNTEDDDVTFRRSGRCDIL